MDKLDRKPPLRVMEEDVNGQVPVDVRFGGAHKEMDSSFTGNLGALLEEFIYNRRVRQVSKD